MLRLGSTAFAGLRCGTQGGLVQIEGDDVPLVIALMGSIPAMDVLHVLNGRFECARCHAVGAWRLLARPMARRNSSVWLLRCTHCDERIVAKVSCASSSSDTARTQMRREYETLCTLQSSYPRDAHYGILVPLDYMESCGQAIMLTRFFEGRDLARYARSVATPRVRQAFHCAGVWLRKLHDTSAVAVPSCTLDVEDKLGYLEDTYGAVLRTDRKVREARRLLEHLGPSIDSLTLPAVSLHGDFKPANVLFDGTRYVGLDLHWPIANAAAYDLAPFLNHLWLTGRTIRHPRATSRHEQAEAGFLAGYGYTGDPCVLPWVQLHFALCHVGSYRQRGRRAAVYANLKVWPLVRRLSLQLQQGI